MSQGARSRVEWVRRLFENGWNQRAFAFLEGSTAAAIPFHYNGTTTTATPESLPGLVEVWHRAFPDLEMEIRHIVADGDLAAVSLVVRGTHRGPWSGTAPTGARIEVEEMMFFRFEEERMVEMWEIFDEDTMRRQLGAQG